MTVVSFNELDRELAEIDENLIRNELTVLERAEHLQRRKEIYEQIHPEAKHGGDRGNQYIGGKLRQTEIISFCQNTAAKTNLTPRTIRQEVQIANNLDSEVKEAIRDTPIADNKTELLKLARLPKEEQKAVAERILEQPNLGVRQAKSKRNDSLLISATDDIAQKTGQKK